MICQPNNGNMLQMLEKLSAQAINHRPRSNGPTYISNTDFDMFECLNQGNRCNIDEVTYHLLQNTKWSPVC